MDESRNVQSRVINNSSKAHVCPSVRYKYSQNYFLANLGSRGWGGGAIIVRCVGIRNWVEL